MDFDRFDFLDELNSRALDSSMKTQNVKRVIGDNRRKYLLKTIFSERKRCYRVGVKRCKRYERFLRKVDRKNKKVLKLLLKNDKRRLKKERKNNKKIAKNKKV